MTPFRRSVGERVVNRGPFLEKVALDPEGADDAEESFQAEGPDSTPPLAEPGRVSGGSLLGTIRPQRTATHSEELPFTKRS